MVIPGPGFPKLGSLLDTIANRSPRGSQEKSVTVSVRNRPNKEDVSPPNTRTGYAKYRTFQFDNFDWEVLLTNSEDLQVAEYGLLGLCVPVNFDAQEITLILPV